MPIKFKPTLGRFKTPIKIVPPINLGDDRMVVWWYSGCYKNPVAKSQPLVLVSFREYLSPGLVGDKVVNRRVPLTSLGQLRIGTVWQHNQCQFDAIFEPQKFDVDFRAGRWHLTSALDARRNKTSPPFPPDLHKLAFEADSTWLIEFNLKTGGKLLVPCIEFFTRCYGCSGELKRVLATYPWEGDSDSASNRLYAPLGEEVEDGKWKVRLRRRMYNGDIVFLAHARYDRYTEKSAKEVYSQLESNYDPRRIKPASIQVWPWFQEPASLKVKGMYFDDGKSFLAFSIVGMSEPTGDPIYRDRENNGTAEKEAPDGSPEAWQGMPERIKRTPPIIDLTGEVEPDTDTFSIEIQDPDFEVLGDEREVIDIRTEQAATRAGLRKGNVEGTSYSAGEPHGTGKKIGRAAIHAPRRLESEGMLLDMWKAMRNLCLKHPTLVRSVHSYTFQSSFSNADTPTLILLDPFADDAVASTTAKRFPYIDPPGADLRGLLVARLMIAEGPVYIVEIERRVRKPKAGQEAKGGPEDSFQGMVFRLRSEQDLHKWLTYFAAAIREKNGVVKRLIAACPGTAFAFSHVSVEPPSTVQSSEQATLEICLPRETTVLHALEKITGRRWLLNTEPKSKQA